MGELQVCVNCNVGTPGYPGSHRAGCPRPKYTGPADVDSPEGAEGRTAEWPPAVTVLELAEYRLGRLARTGEDFDAAGLPIWGGCEGCHASIAAYNAYPSQTGYLRCKECIGPLGWVTVEEADRAIFGEAARVCHPAVPCPHLSTGGSSTPGVGQPAEPWRTQ